MLLYSNNLLKLIGYRTQLSGKQVEMSKLASENTLQKRVKSPGYFLNDVISMSLQGVKGKGAKKLSFTNYLEVIIRNNL